MWIKRENSHPLKMVFRKTYQAKLKKTDSSSNSEEKKEAENELSDEDINRESVKIIEDIQQRIRFTNTDRNRNSQSSQFRMISMRFENLKQLNFIYKIVRN